MPKVYRIEFIDYPEPYFCQDNEKIVKEWIALRCVDLPQEGRDLIPGMYQDRWGRVQLQMIEDEEGQVIVNKPLPTVPTPDDPNAEFTDPVIVGKTESVASTIASKKLK